MQRVFITGASSGTGAALARRRDAPRLELKPYEIRVVTLAPGYIDTPMTRHNRFPMPFLMPAARFAERAERAIARGDRYRVLPWQMGIVAKLLRALPDPLFDLAFARAPGKARREGP